MTTQPISELRFQPEEALGWRDIGLDGLGCFLRCLEAVLLHHGYSVRQVAQGMTVPLDLVRRTAVDGALSVFPACTAQWRSVEDGRRTWSEIEAFLRKGKPVVLMPDGFHWPDDPFEGTNHYFHHMVLATRLDRDRLSMLDTDADKAAGYVRVLPVTERLKTACRRWATVEVHPPPPERSADEMAARLVPDSLLTLPADIASIRAFCTKSWTGGRLHVLLARALDSIVLGDIQPQLFLFGHALDGPASPEVVAIRSALLHAAGRAQKLGLLTLGLHRYDAEGIYGLLHEDIISLADSLVGVLEAMSRYQGTSVVEPSVEDERFLTRLRMVANWCFGETGTGEVK